MREKVTLIGAGPGGYVAAVRAAQLGAEVTVIEQDHVGGTCLNRGCIPSKVMKVAADMMESFHRAPEFGIQVKGDIRLDMKALMARKQTVIRNQAQGILQLFRHHKIRYLKGRGCIQGPNAATVELEDGKTLEVSWDKLILALGSRPLQVSSFPFDGKRILSSNEALNLEKIPESILIVGGGVIGCEFAFILAALGSKVTVVEALSRVLPLPSVDEECSKVLQREMKKRRIQCMVNRRVEAITEEAGNIRVTLGPGGAADGERTSEIVEVETVLVCIGRSPNTAHAGLETLGIRLTDGGWIQTNARMETSVSGVYAVGDVLGPSRAMLAHVATAEGLTAAENALGAERVMNYEVVPAAIFTMPEVAVVGLTEVQARDQGFRVRADTVLFRTVGKAQVIGEIVGQAKLVSEAESGRILGVHLVGPHAADLIAEGALAVRLGAGVAEVAETIHAHPTLAEVMLEVSFKALDRPLHG